MPVDATGTVSLNVDLGELSDEPEELYALATIVNVACGGHAGDALSMARAVSMARAAGAEIAAHPSYPDRAGFGRTKVAISRAALRASVAEQCAALQAAASGQGAAATRREVASGQGVATGDGAVRAVKLHGALYHEASRDPAIAAVVMEGAAEGLGVSAVTWIGPERGALFERARAEGLPYLREGFADRGVLADGSLVPRGQPGALIEDPALAAAQAVALARSGRVETVCVHSDTRGAVAIARAVREALLAAGLLGGAR